MRLAWLVLLVASVAHADDQLEFAVLHRFGGIDVIETSNQARHEHGGPPAKLYNANLNLAVRDRRSHTIEVKKLEIVFANCGKKPAKRDIQTLKITGHELFTWDDADPIAKGAASVKTPAGRPRRFAVNVGFEGIETYAGCAFVLDLAIDRVRKKITLPLAVIRFEPLREEP